MPPQPEMAVPYAISEADFDDRNETLQLNSTISTTEQYRKYYGSGAYDRRYPRANHFTLDAIRSRTAPTSKILDFGCGSGRYAIPLAPLCKTIVAYDRCREAIDLLNRRSQQNITPTRDIGDVSHATPYDMIVCIFGVLSHIPERQARLNTLRFLWNCLADDGLLFLSVPNRLRRFYGEQLASAFKGDFSGRIEYCRRCVGQSIPYYLYTPASLRSELEECKFSVESVKAESLLPERYITNSDCALKLEKKVLNKIPPRLGYGLLTVARKA